MQLLTLNTFFYESLYFLFCLDLEIGIVGDNDTFVGIAVGSGREMAEFLINNFINGIRTPIQNVKDMVGVLSFPHDNLSDKFRDIFDLFVTKTTAGAVHYFNFWRDLFQIIFNFFARLANLTSLLIATNPLFDNLIV